MLQIKRNGLTPNFRRVGTLAGGINQCYTSTIHRTVCTNQDIVHKSVLYQYETQDGVHKSGHCAQISVVPVRYTGRCAQIRTLCTNQEGVQFRLTYVDQDVLHRLGQCSQIMTVCIDQYSVQISTLYGYTVR